jgi:hypothetical protein
LNRIPVAVFAALAILTVSAPLAAQGRSTVTTATLEAAVVAPRTTPRAAVQAVLTSGTAASQVGLSAEQVSTRIAALDDATIQQLHERILAGGASNVVISTTAIIIILLILILLTN